MEKERKQRTIVAATEAQWSNLKYFSEMLIHSRIAEIGIFVEIDEANRTAFFTELPWAKCDGLDIVQGIYRRINGEQRKRRGK